MLINILPKSIVFEIFRALSIPVPYAANSGLLGDNPYLIPGKPYNMDEVNFDTNVIASGISSVSPKKDEAEKKCKHADTPHIDYMQSDLAMAEMSDPQVQRLLVQTFIKNGYEHFASQDLIAMQQDPALWKAQSEKIADILSSDNLNLAIESAVNTLKLKEAVSDSDAAPPASAYAMQLAAYDENNASSAGPLAKVDSKVLDALMDRVSPNHASSANHSPEAKQKATEIITGFEQNMRIVLNDIPQEIRSDTDKLTELVLEETNQVLPNDPLIKNDLQYVMDSPELRALIKKMVDEGMAEAEKQKKAKEDVFATTVMDFVMIGFRNAFAGALGPVLAMRILNYLKTEKETAVKDENCEECKAYIINSNELGKGWSAAAIFGEPTISGVIAFLLIYNSSVSKKNANFTYLILACYMIYCMIISPIISAFLANAIHRSMTLHKCNHHQNEQSLEEESDEHLVNKQSLEAKKKKLLFLQEIKIYAIVCMITTIILTIGLIAKYNKISDDASSSDPLKVSE